MAQQIVIRRTCDIGGEDVPATETYEYSFGGEHYTIDLGEENAKLFEAEMSYWMTASQKTRASRGTRKQETKKETRRPSKIDAPVVRAWAREHGWPELSNRGRVSKIITNAYLAAVE